MPFENRLHVVESKFHSCLPPQCVMKGSFNLLINITAGPLTFSTLGMHANNTLLH